MSRRIIAIAVAACALAIRPADAQETAGSVRGRVFNETQQPLPRALVKLTRSGAIVRAGATDSEGVFRLAGLAPGAYTLSVEHLGYRPQVRNLGIRRGTEVLVDLLMVIAPVALSRIEVSIPPVEIRKDQTEFGSALTQRQLKLLPIPRTASELVAFTAGARPAQVWGGASAQANSYLIDGLPANDPGSGGELVQPSIRWIERIEVLGLGAGAEYGNFQGGLVSVTTKSGSNELRGAFYNNAENATFSASNLGMYEIGAQITGRYQAGGELAGAVVADRLFFYASGEYTAQTRQHIDHLHLDDARFSATLEQRADSKIFGKLTWQPNGSNLLELSGGRIDLRADNHEATGYETADAALRYKSPSRFLNASWQYNFRNAVLELKGARYLRDDRREPYQTQAVPSLQLYGVLPPFTNFQNAPIRYRHDARTRQASATLTVHMYTGMLEHRLKLGGEYSAGDYIDQRKRNGGLTWLPVKQSRFRADDPATWTFDAGGVAFLPALVGGEVDLDAGVVNAALFVQDYISLGSHLSINPGVRLGRWQGGLTPAGGGDHIDAVRATAADPRIGVVWDVTGRNDFVLKAHWGRFHQSMFAQFYDRVAGGNVFNNQQLWYYWQPVLSSATMTLSEAERAALAQSGRLQLVEEIRLNETGRVENYRQPYIDQWLIGTEKMLGARWKAKAVYVNRRNRDMVALSDRNIDSNYTSWKHVLVYPVFSPTPVDYNGTRLLLHRAYIPNDVIIQWLRDATKGGVTVPRPLKIADTLQLKWNPEYVLGNVAAAQRQFDQLQMQLETSQQRWGANASLVWTNLRGNWDNVSGYEERSAYDDPARYTAGPFVHPNEAVNFSGQLDNFSSWEWKLSVYGELPWKLSAGAYWNWGSGDHFTPVYSVTPLVNDYVAAPFERPDSLPSQLFLSISGQRIMVQPRGARTYPGRASLDLHLEREFPVRGLTATVTMDVFNLFNNNSATDWNTWVNRGQDYYRFLNPTPWKSGGFNGAYAVPSDDPNTFFMAVRERIPPRVLRMGTSFSF